jgi:hypothetical protein
MREQVVNMTIDLEGLRSVVCQVVSQELRADVTGSVHSNRIRGATIEVTFDLWIERCGTKINRHLFVVLRPQYWNCGDFEKLVCNYANTVISRDLLKQQNKDFSAKAGMN